MKIGDIVNYHSIIGGSVTSDGHEIKHIQFMPNNFGCDVAWITGKSGCVAISALSNDEHPMGPIQICRPPTRSQQRYQEYLDNDGYYSFSDFIGVDTECRTVSGGYQFYNQYKRITGPVCALKKDAKAGYKALLKERRA